MIDIPTKFQLFSKLFVRVHQNLLLILSRNKTIDYKNLKFSTKVPTGPIISKFYKISDKNIEAETIQLLERLSLVNLDNIAALNTLKTSIKFAKNIENIDTSKVEALYSVVEKRNLYLRNDKVIDGIWREGILQNAKSTEEDYFVSPPAMNPLNHVLDSLKCTNYLDALLTHKEKLYNIKLLSNGVQYAKQLESYWRNNRDDNVESNVKFSNINNNQFEYKSRLSFLKTPELYLNIKKYGNADMRCPLVIKSIVRSDASCSVPFPIPNTDALSFQSVNQAATQLICDYVMSSERVIEKFHNTQRKRKIWWMRCSANPSRYYIENCDLSDDEEYNSDNCQSVDIKARFPYGLANIEHITMAFLYKPLLQQYALKSSIAIIRSVINLEAATCAMLLDGYDHNRNSLLLHRKLAPIQCSVACLHANNSLEDLRDLCTHLSSVIHEASLRLSKENNLFTNSIAKLEEYWQYSDNIGIPYVVLLNEATLSNGLLKLRSRDTTLLETIHISDIPDYLCNIFNH